MNRARVLVVEDQSFIALDLALAIEDAGGEVVGPAASVEEALALLSATSVAAAILDVNLIDGDCSPVIEVLMGLNAPIIVQTGVGMPATMVARFPDLVVQIKPCVAANLITQLGALLSEHKHVGGIVAPQTMGRPLSATTSNSERTA